MDSAEREKENKPAWDKGGQKMSATVGKDHAMLERIREARRNCTDGVKMLPVVRYERKLWFLDERLSQLRNIRNPHDFINLNDFEVDHFRREAI